MNCRDEAGPQSEQRATLVRTMDKERDLGVQPLAALLAKHELGSHDLVRASTEQLTHKMVARAVKGRRLTPKAMKKVLNAVNAAATGTYGFADLFNYTPVKRAEQDEAGADATVE